MASDKLMQRLRRCLALAASAAGTPEGDLAKTRAEEIARKAGVDLRSVKLDDAPKGKAERTYYTPENSALWRASLAWAVAPFAGVTMLRDPKRWHVLGRPQDVETWRALYERAVREIDGEASRYVAGLERPPAWGCGDCGWSGDEPSRATSLPLNRCPECDMRATRLPQTSVRTEGDTFRKAAASGFRDRLAKHKAEAEASEQGRATAAVLVGTPTAALVLVSRVLEVQTLKETLYPKSRKVPVKSSGTRAARSAGYAYGSSMGVHRGEVK